MSIETATERVGPRRDPRLREDNRPTRGTGELVKPGDFVRLRGSRPPRYARVTETDGNCVHFHGVDGWAGSIRLDEVVGVLDLSEVWQAIEVEQSRIDRRLADLNKTRALAFERALKAGR